jgi:nucleotide-binding universal stress UspA family protein
MKVLLVPVANRPESKVAVDIACGLAEKLDANVIGCHLRPHRDASKEYKNKGLPLFGSADAEALRELSRKGSPASVRAAAAMFSRQTDAAGFTAAKGPRLNTNRLAIWHELVGSPDRLMSITGPLSDLTVVSRPTSTGRLAQMFVQAALLQSGRPVLVLPQQQKKIPGRRIAIAWNQSPEASRTVSACMPLLAVAEQVSIISCGSEDQRGPKSGQLKDYLKYWGINARTFRTKGRYEEQELLQSYRDSKSDLLVMGAYSRSRLREVVFGGMTEKMLWGSSIPVIMQHG